MSRYQIKKIIGTSIYLHDQMSPTGHKEKRYNMIMDFSDISLSSIVLNVFVNIPNGIMYGYSGLAYYDISFKKSGSSTPIILGRCGMSATPDAGRISIPLVEEKKRLPIVIASNEYNQFFSSGTIKKGPQKIINMASIGGLPIEHGDTFQIVVRPFLSKFSHKEGIEEPILLSRKNDSIDYNINIIFEITDN